MCYNIHTHINPSEINILKLTAKLLKVADLLDLMMKELLRL